MNKQELIERIEGLKNIFGNKCEYVKIDFVIELASELDELQPLKLKDIISRMKQLFPNNRIDWINGILHEFGDDFGLWKYKDGYEQGKLEGLIEREKVTIPQYVADWIEKIKGKGEPLYYALDHTPPEEVDLWFCEDEVNRQNIFARALLDGYEVEEEKRFLVKMKGMDEDFVVLKLDKIKDSWYLGSDTEYNYTKAKHTRKELEEAGFGDVFNSPLFEVEEVQDDSKI